MTGPRSAQAPNCLSIIVSALSNVTARNLARRQRSHQAGSPWACSQDATSREAMRFRGRKIPANELAAYWVTLSEHGRDGYGNQ